MREGDTCISLYAEYEAEDKYNLFNRNFMYGVYVKCGYSQGGGEQQGVPTVGLWDDQSDHSVYILCVPYFVLLGAYRKPSLFYYIILLISLISTYSLIGTYYYLLIAIL